MNTKSHGVFSLGLIGIAIAIAAISACSKSLLLCFGYLFFSLLSFAIIAVGYCAKCPCKNHCPHVLPGVLANKIKRQIAPYTKLELAGLLTALVILLILPNIWLWHSLTLSVIYWLIILIAIIEIRKFICKPCGNIHCPLNKNI